MTGFLTVLTTTATDDEAEAIAEALLADDLAACVQIVPIRSRYLWQGQVKREPEQLLLIKTRAELFEILRGRIRAMHSYHTPDIIALPIAAGDADYLAWLGGVTAAAPGPER